MLKFIKLMTTENELKCICIKNSFEIKKYKKNTKTTTYFNKNLMLSCVYMY